MGLLITFATSYSWENTQKYTDVIKTHGLNQFLNAYYKKMDLKQSFVWGDEVEYSVVKLDKKNKNSKLSLRAFDLLSKLQKPESDYEIGLRSEVPESLWRPEAGRQMLESTPGIPYNATLKDLATVETNMKRRRKLIKDECHPDDYPITLVTYPRLGCPDELYPEYKPNGPIKKSIFLPDEIIDHSTRAISVYSNIKGRRGSKVAINIPIYHDLKMNDSFIDPSVSLYNDEDKNLIDQVALPNHIYMDCSSFGGACCCLQVTLQACDINEARNIYDQFVPLAPIMLALTAATPILKGYLANTDTRWDVISQSLDDRTEMERSTKPNNTSAVNERRYGPVNTYISNDKKYKSKYNDINISYDKYTYEQLLNKNVDESLAKHISHIFNYDSLTVPSKLMTQQDDENTADHFDNIQSACYQSVRFKLPTPNCSIGWRVEFRTMEVQLTDFENAAFSTFIILLARTIKYFNLNFYIPMSKVHENFNTALKREAVINNQFYFRKNVYTYEHVNGGKHEDDYKLMTINDIFNGQSNDDGYNGIIPLIKKYLNEANVDDKTKQVLFNYLDFISKRASGELMTTASYLRTFVRSHPDYKYDSIITPSINYDIVKLANDINHNSMKIPELYGDFLL